MAGSSFTHRLGAAGGPSQLLRGAVASPWGATGLKRSFVPISFGAVFSLVVFAWVR